MRHCLFFCLIFSTSLFAQNSNCVLPNTYKYTNVDSNYTFERLGNIEIHTHRAFDGEFIIEYLVTEISPCMYKLDFSKVIQSIENVDIGFQEHLVQKIVSFDEKELVISTLIDFQGNLIPEPKQIRYYILSK